MVNRSTQVSTLGKNCYCGLRFRDTFPCLIKLSCQCQVLLFLVQYYTVGKRLGLAVILRAFNSKSLVLLSILYSVMM